MFSGLKGHTLRKRTQIHKYKIRNQREYMRGKRKYKIQKIDTPQIQKIHNTEK